MTVEWVEDDRTVETLDIPEVEPVRRIEKGTCKVCGKPARSLTSTVCDDHDGRKSRSGSSSSRSTGRRTTKPPTADELTNKVLAKLLVGITFLVAVRMVASRTLHDPDDAIAEELAMTNDEAKSITHPFARFIEPTPLNTKYGRHAVENIDVVDAGFAFWDWYSRTQKFLRNTTKQRRLATVTPINVKTNDRREGTGEQAEPTSSVSVRQRITLSDISSDAGSSI